MVPLGEINPSDLGSIKKLNLPPLHAAAAAPSRSVQSIKRTSASSASALLDDSPSSAAGLPPRPKKRKPLGMHRSLETSARNLRTDSHQAIFLHLAQWAECEQMLRCWITTPYTSFDAMQRTMMQEIVILRYGDVSLNPILCVPRRPHMWLPPAVANASV